MMPVLPRQHNERFGFLIVISPPKEVWTYVNELKSEFYNKYGPYEAMHSKPHITICNFLLLLERQDKVLSTFRNELSNIEPFLLELNGFDSFDNSKVIYLKVAKSDALDELKELIYKASIKVYLKKNFHLFTEPHLTIAKNLKPAYLELAKADYLTIPYQNSFRVDKLKVLRYNFNEKRYFDISDLPLGNCSG